MWAVANLELTMHRIYDFQNSGTRMATIFLGHAFLRRFYSIAVWCYCILSVLLELVGGSGPNFQDLYASVAWRRWASNHAKSTSSSFFSNMMRATVSQHATVKPPNGAFLFCRRPPRTIDAARGTPSAAVYAEPRPPRLRCPSTVDVHGRLEDFINGVRWPGCRAGLSLLSVNGYRRIFTRCRSSPCFISTAAAFVSRLLPGAWWRPDQTTLMISRRRHRRPTLCAALHQFTKQKSTAKRRSARFRRLRPYFFKENVSMTLTSEPVTLKT